MATKRKSIIEEALLEAKSLEDALKANTKEMLAAHMKQEIENIVESSLTEDEEEVIDVEGSDEEMEEMPALDAGDDSDGDADEADSEESELMDLDIDLDALAGGDAEEVELDVVDLPASLDMGDEEELDLTGASDEEVIAVFKKMSDEDEVEVVKDEDGIHLTDNETGAEYYIKEGDEHYEEGYKMDEESDCMHEEAGCGKHVDEGDDEIMYEIELDEKHQGYYDKEDESIGMRLGKGKADAEERDLSYGTWAEDREKDHEDGWGHEDHIDEDQGDYDKEDESLGMRLGKGSGTKAKRDDSYGVWGEDREKDHEDGWGHEDHMDEVVDLDEEDEITEDKTQNNKQSGPYGGGRQRYSGAKAGTSYANESKKSRKTLTPRKPKNVERVSESKIMKEYKELKSKNEEYKGALKVFKNKLNEVALFNTNLAYVNRLFTEHSTTKNEKMEILKKFDSAESIKESKTIYKSVKSELETKSPITESVENKVNKTVKSSKSDLNESTAYVDPQITAIKDLMRKIS